MLNVLEDDTINPVEPFLRTDRMPHIWCPGCGIGTTVNSFARALIESKADLDSIALVSGIGCTGRVAGYVKLDSFHTTHGRAIPFATGLKLANPKLNVVVVSYGITSRVAQRAIDLARDRGLKVGKLRLITAWPFPDKKIVDLAARVKAFVVPELNLGQMVREVERAAAGKAKTFAVPHAGGGVHNPDEILNAIVDASRC